MKLHSSLAVTMVHIGMTSLYYFTIVHTIYRRIHLELLGQFPTTASSNGWLLKYFTYWSLFIHIFTFTTTLICDFSANDDESSSIFKLRNALFNRLALPMTFFVSTMFWSMNLVDRKLLYRGVSSLVYPWKNHLLHTFPTIVVLVDNFLVDHKRQQEKNGHRLLWTVVLLYSCYAGYVGHFRGHWVYPFLGKFNTLSRLFIMLGFISIETFFYYLGGLLYRLAWPMEV